MITDVQKTLIKRSKIRLELIKKNKTPTQTHKKSGRQEKYSEGNSEISIWFKIFKKQKDTISAEQSMHTNMFTKCKRIKLTGHQLTD